jgi:ElaA protein
VTAIDWQWYAFDELTPSLLYSLLKLRQDVFILEQQCFYPDLDDQDQSSQHLLGLVNDQVHAYLRIIPKTLDGEPVYYIGRVLTDETLRGQGAGRAMMTMALDYLDSNYTGCTVQLSAQLYLQAFYESLGFQVISEPYDEDGIMHIDMQLVAN